VSEQKVSSMEPVSVDVAGWCDGVLLLLQIRDGRLCAWSQRVCSRAGARRSVAATPAGWAEFGERNARLASELMAERDLVGGGAGARAEA